MSETLEERIIRHEGFCAIPKPDAKGMYVIGFGCDITPAECENYKDGITWDEAEKLMEYRLNILKQNTAKEFPWLAELDAVRQSVILEMAYQMGVSGVAAFHGMIAAIQEKDWDKAAQAMLDSLWHQQTPSRAEELAQMMLKG